MTKNRRKCRALNHANAHKRVLGVRVGALTNKAAHYRFDLVRTGHRALRGLTSISVAATCNICRERRGASAAARYGVRNLAAAAHFADFRECAYRAHNCGFGASECAG